MTELDGITDNVTKIQRQKSSTKFYNLIDLNQNTEISNKIKLQILLEFSQKTIPVIVHNKQNSWHSQLSRTCLIGTLAYQEIDEKIDVNRKSSGISGVWRTSTVCNR